MDICNVGGCIANLTLYSLQVPEAWIEEGNIVLALDIFFFICYIILTPSKLSAHYSQSNQGNIELCWCCSLSVQLVMLQRNCKVLHPKKRFHGKTLGTQAVLLGSCRVKFIQSLTWNDKHYILILFGQTSSRHQVPSHLWEPQVTFKGLSISMQYIFVCTYL